jgi:exosortase/archaeosortase family protein
VGLLGAVLGGWLLFNTASWRDGEAWSAAHVVQALLGSTYHPDGSSTFFVGLGSSHAIGLNITPACSTAPLAGALLVITGLLIAFTRIDPMRAGLGLLIAVTVVGVVNVVRLLLLSWSAAEFGVSGWFEWLHVYGGSFVSIAAVVVACGLYLRFVRRPPAPLAGRGT